MTLSPSILVTTADLARLETVLERAHAGVAEALDAELARAETVAPEAIGPDVVTMNSDVEYEDVATGERRTVRLVYPGDADASAGRVSVLAPLGSALLGLRVGQTIDWTMPSGVRRLRIVAVPFQPEAAGRFDL